MVMAHPTLTAAPVADWHVGIVYSQPARNEAVSPESAISSGSANSRINPLDSKALRTTSRLPPLVARFATATPKGAAPDSNVPAAVKSGMPMAPLPAGDPGAGTGFPLASTPVTAGRPRGCPDGVKPPVPVLNPRFPPLLAPYQFTPNSRLALRAT